jgi:hypothetical protein
MGGGDEVAVAARELVDRHGPEGARRRAAERVAGLERMGDWPSHAVAARVLNEVERLVTEGSVRRRDP